MAKCWLEISWPKSNNYANERYNLLKQTNAAADNKDGTDSLTALPLFEPSVFDVLQNTSNGDYTKFTGYLTSP